MFTIIIFSFELIATFSGASASTGYVTEERTSYISTDLLWGHRFMNMVHYDGFNKNYVIDYDEFDSTEQVNSINYSNCPNELNSFSLD